MICRWSLLSRWSLTVCDRRTVMSPVTTRWPRLGRTYWTKFEQKKTIVSGVFRVTFLSLVSLWDAVIDGKLGGGIRWNIHMSLRLTMSHERRSQNIEYRMLSCDHGDMWAQAEGKIERVYVWVRLKKWIATTTTRRTRYSNTPLIFVSGMDTTKPRPEKHEKAIHHPLRDPTSK